jgi:hypothetical protein
VGKLSRRPHVNTIRNLLRGTSALRTVSTLDEFTALILWISEDWQREDWRDAEGDRDMLLNNVRLVGKVWFRGVQAGNHGVHIFQIFPVPEVAQ